MPFLLIRWWPTWLNWGGLTMRSTPLNWRRYCFYETHFGFETYFEHRTPTGLDIAYLRLGDTVLELTGRADPPLNGFHFCLETDDFEGAVAALKAAGVE